MDLSSVMGTLLSDESVSAISKSANTDSSQVQDVLSMALPSLLNGISSQAGNETTSASLVKALSNHGSRDASDLGSFLGNVDVADGDKIVGHLLGPDKNNVANAVALKTGSNSDQVLKLLATIAPLIMTLIGQQAAKKTTKTSNSGIDAGGIGDIIGAVLGGGSPSSSSAGGDILGDLAGQVLGGLFKE